VGLQKREVLFVGRKNYTKSYRQCTFLYHRNSHPPRYDFEILIERYGLTIIFNVIFDKKRYFMCIFLNLFIE
jgi:hypothetical protein